MNPNSETLQKNSKILREIGFEMRVLMVEDDLIIQQQLKTFFLRFFGHVDTADNGLEAFDLYNRHSYDLIITDLTMPQMGGIELSANIRSMNPNQKILVVSAHSESDKLIELINIGVDGFMLKPIDMDRVLQILTRTCQSIYDHKMLHYFNNLLEQTNLELKESNIELESTLSKLQQLRDGIPEEQTVQYDAVSIDEDFYLQDSYDLERTNEALEQIEDDFNLLLVSSDRNTNQTLLAALTIFLKHYTHEIHLIPQFQGISYKLVDLTQCFGTLHEEVENMDFLIPSIISLFDHLEQWRRSIFIYRNVDDIHFMDDYLITKMDDILTAIENFQKEQL